MTEPCMFPNLHEPFYCRIHADVRLRLTDERCRRGVTLTQPQPRPTGDTAHEPYISPGPDREYPDWHLACLECDWDERTDTVTWSAHLPRPTGDTALLTLQQRLGIAGLTQSVAIVVHRWKHPTYALGEQGCRCAKDAASAVDVSLSEGLVSSPATPPALDAALERVESEHRRGDWTEDGFVGNSIDGLECLVCGSGWPCAAQALRAAIKGDAS